MDLTHEEIEKIKKIKKVYLEDAQYYIEDVRKNVIEKLTYEKVYKQGFNINTPIDLKLQKIATNSLRNGLILYDKRNIITYFDIFNNILIKIKKNRKLW